MTLFFSDTTAAEALNWLETHGITMISSNDSESVVTTAIQEGQTITLTGNDYYEYSYLHNGNCSHKCLAQAHQAGY